ncbi:MAG TPA: hypothetical protein EYO59_01570 [Chromatiaceae bacterium]|nr:hypothetical protein [Chromatiaceae bacterium]
MKDRVLNGSILGLGIAIVVLLGVLVKKEYLGPDLIYIEVPMIMECELNELCPLCDYSWPVLNPEPIKRPAIRNIRNK